MFSLSSNFAFSCNRWTQSSAGVRMPSDHSSATCVATIKVPYCVRSKDDCVNSVSFHPTELILAAGRGNGVVKLWCMSRDNFKVTRVFTVDEQKSPISSVAFHPTVPILAIAITDSCFCELQLWRLSSYNSLLTYVTSIKPHSTDSHTSFGLRCVVFHPTAPFLAICGHGSAEVWR